MLNWECRKIHARGGCHLITDCQDTFLLKDVAQWMRHEVVSFVGELEIENGPVKYVYYLKPITESYLN